MTKGLIAADRRLMRSASSEVVTQSFAEIIRFFRRDRWLARANVYSGDTVARIRNDVKRNRPPVDRDMRHYVAASTLTHCADGWSLVGRSIDAVLRGDANASRHLAYYAELRATASLLACQGIGVFDRHSFVVDSTGRCVKLANTNGTHRLMWLGLSCWMESPAAARSLGSVVAPGRVPVDSLLSEFGHQTPAAALVISRWLRQWGLDLYRLHRDRATRNLVSYRPTALLPGDRASDVSRDVETIAEYWKLLEPRETPFEPLDRALTYSGTSELFRGHYGLPPAQDTNAYAAAVEYMLSHVELPSEAWAMDLQAFLATSAQAGHTPLLLGNALRGDAIGTPGQHLQVIARALLLLRLATGMCTSVLRESGADRESLRFWWQSFGLGRGLWPGPDFDGEFRDLWDDVDNELARLTVWAAQHGRTVSQLRSLPSSPLGLEAPFSVLGSLERVLLWGIAL